MLPTISIIVPACNSAAWLPQTLTSILRIDYPPELLEICLVDDGSTDGTAVIARVLLRNAVAPWKVINSKHLGPGGARNIGLRNTQGAWVQFLDSDDLVSPQKLRVQGNVAWHTSPEVAVVFSQWTTLEKHEGVWLPQLQSHLPQVGAAPLLELLKTENFPATGCQLFNRDWLLRVQGYDETCSMAEDTHLALRLAIAGGNFLEAQSAVPLFFYRKRSGSLSTGNRISFWEGCVRNALLAENHWGKSGNCLSSEQNEALLGIYGNALRAFYPEHRSQFLSLLAHVKRLKPGYTPSSPRSLKWLSRTIGYCPAEAVALAYRRAKGRAGLGRVSS